jgi:hypothetical protein
LTTNNIRYYNAAEKYVPPDYSKRKIVIYGVMLQSGEYIVLNYLDMNREKNFQLTNRIRQTLDAPLEIKYKKNYWSEPK